MELKINRLNIINPFFMYVYAFLFGLTVYSVGWSDLYPPLSHEMVIFLIFTFIISILLGMLTIAANLVKIIKINYISYLYTLTFFIIIVLIIEIIYNRTIPLVEILVGNNYDTRDFTFPFLHLILTSLSMFLASLSFYRLLIFDTKQKSSTIFFILNLIPAILLVHRSALVIIFLNCVFLFLFIKKINVKIFIFTCILFIIFFIGFGVIGNFRTQSQSGDFQRNFSIAFMEATNANDKAFDSPIAEIFYWTYLYISSPLANFQNTVNYSYRNEITVNSIVQFMKLELLPKIISKRITRFEEKKERVYTKRIIPWLTVGTLYSDSYGIIGWLGPLLLYMSLMAFIFIYIYIIPKNEFYLVGMCTLMTLISLCLFTNMLIYTPLIFQLIYPLFFTFIKKIKVNI